MPEPEILGTIHLTKETEHYDHNYEVAAWWRRITLLPGDYPVFVQSHDPRYATVVVAARIEEEHYPSLFGGLPVYPNRDDDRRFAKRGEYTTLLVTAYTSHIRNTDQPISWLGGTFTHSSEE